MVFIVPARRAISSPVRGSGTRRLRSCAPISATSPRMASTGRSDRRTASQAMTPISSATAGTPAVSVVRTVSTVACPAGSTGAAA